LRHLGVSSNNTPFPVGRIIEFFEGVGRENTMINGH
jgi:hypothetical protein